jgi:hypothetical protein
LDLSCSLDLSKAWSLKAAQAPAKEATRVANGLRMSFMRQEVVAAA